MKHGIFTKPQHVEKIVNFLNTSNFYRDNDYIISTNRWEPQSFDFEIGISYCFPWLIDLDAPENKDRIWYNYHPSPLPEYSNWGHWARQIKDKHEVSGVSLHLIDKGIDTGPVLAVMYFPLRNPAVNTHELADINHYYLFQLFKESIWLLKYKPKTREKYIELEERYYGSKKNP